MGLARTKVKSSSGSSSSSIIGSDSSISIATSEDVEALLDQMFALDLGPKIPGSDFVILEKPQEKFVGMLYGVGGVGKTFFACSMPRVPSYLINLDGRAEKTVRDLRRLGHDVRYLPCAFPLEIMKMDHQAAKAIAQRVLTRLIDNFNFAKNEAAKDGGVIVIDTVDELLQLIRLAVRGRADSVAGTKEDDFGKSGSIINESMWYFTKKVRQGMYANLILLSRAKALGWGPDATGEQTQTAHGIFYDSSDWVLQIRVVSAQTQMVALTQRAKAAKKTLTPIELLRVKNAGPILEFEVSKGGTAYGEMGKVYRESDWTAAGLEPLEYVVRKLDAGGEGAIVDEDKDEDGDAETVAVDAEDESWLEG